jgi:endonuclease/exonuclease/phosphatase family metal-dependent hydrolase
VCTVAAILETPLGALLVYGTVMPWHADPGPTADAPNWSEHHRVLPEQAVEWAALRAAYPDVPLCVAGDFNTDLGGANYYGTKRGRAALVDGLRAAELVCLTSTDRVPAGRLAHPPIDHVCVSASLGAGAAVVDAWEGTTADGVRLSDHSGLVVELTGRPVPHAFAR